MGRDPKLMHPELRRRVMEVAGRCRRRRWMARLKQFGWLFFGLTCVFTLLLAILSPDGRTGGVLFTAYVMSIISSGVIIFYRALREPVTLQQVALYIDEHHPELENRITSALDLATEDHPGASEWLIERFLEETVPIVRTTSFADVLNRRVAFGFASSACALLLSSAIVVYLFGHLWLPSIQFILPDRMAEVIALPFTVEPGDVRVRVGDNLMVWVRTEESDRALQMRWRVAGGVWQQSGVQRTGDDNVFYHQFMSIQTSIQYQVRYGRRRSPVYQITAWTPAEVESIDLIYHYPDYLRRPSREVPNSGNITAIEGTKVDMEVWVNKSIKRAELVFDSGERIALELRADNAWHVPLTITRNDTYRIELVDQEDAPSEYNPEYTITMARDKAPEIRIDFPRGDNEVTMLEEIPFDFNVSDDYGFNEFGLQYEIAGREPVRIAMNKNSDLVLKAEGHHQIMLEDLGLEVGDFITWTIWATDTKPDRSEYEVMGDPYFLEIRPFRREYREALTGAGGGGGGAMEDGDLEQAQKDVLIATWNLRRENRYMDDEEFSEKRSVIVETQDELLDKVAAAGGMMQTPSKEILKLREAMRGSIDALTRAALPDPKADLSAASVHQQMALRLMARMKPREAQVQQMQGGGGGGGAQDRPDISELELARNRNFYEQENLTREQQEAADEVLKKIKELAQRQQNVNEELSKLISELQNAETEEERERLARKLERLTEEMRDNLERLDEARQELSSDQLNNEQVRTAQDALDQARRQMNRSLEQMEQDRLQQARTSGSRAMDALEDLQEQLQQFGRGAAAQRMRELQEKMDELRDRQHEIAEGAEQALGYHKSPSMADQEALENSATDIQKKKEELAKDFIDMMDEASELAERSRQTQELMSRKLGDWMRETSREGILEDIEESVPYIEYGIWDTAVREEKRIAAKFDVAAERLRAVADSLVDDELEGMQRALERMDRLLDREEVAGLWSDEAEGEQQAGSEQEEEAEAGGERGEQEGQTSGENGESEQRMARAEEGGQQGSQDGESQQDSPGGSAQAQGNSRGSERNNSTRAGGSRNGFDRRGAMRDFADSGYQDWLRDLRDVETLLPPGTKFRTEVTRIRERIEMMRQDWRRRALAPQYDLFLEVVARPLEDTANRLQREIEKNLSDKEFLLVDEGDIPDRYKERVSNYFKRLSDAEGAR